jgi:chitin disaccharide deacetylase
MSATGRRLRRLIVNADDFGLSPGVNAGVITGFEHGIITSATLMVRWPAAAAAAAYAREKRTLSVGLHVDLGEWEYRNGEWQALYHVLDLDDSIAVRAEITRQVDVFCGLLRRDPTHLDSHQHVHHRAGIHDVMTELSERLGVPLRRPVHTLAHVGGFYGQDNRGQPVADAISVSRLIQILAALPEGTSELGCHPGLGRDVHGMYVSEREQELGVLCDPRIGEAIAAEGIELISFHDVTAHDCPIVAV